MASGFKRGVIILLALVVVVTTVFLFNAITQEQAWKKHGRAQAASRTLVSGLKSTTPSMPVFEKLQDLIDLRNSSACESLKTDNNSGFRDVCFREIALKTLNMSLCEKIENPLTRVKCWRYINRTKSANASAGGGYVRLPEDVVSVISQAAESKNTSDCGSISNLTFRTSCVIQVGIALEDSRVCEEGLIQPYKNVCFYNLAWKLNDSSVCSKVEGNRSIDTCNELVKSGGMRIGRRREVGE